ncbi:MAG: hypothetical protein PPP58_06000 [Natronomonas sp.]
MKTLLENDLTRAGTFFLLAFGSTVVFGTALGDVRLGVETGLTVGIAFAAFAYLFIEPTTTEESDAETDPAEEANDES